MLYKDILDNVYSEENRNNIMQSTGDFQCPNTGWGCIITWDITNGNVWAEICDTGIWDLNKCKDMEKVDTIRWCEKFGIKKALDIKCFNNILDNILGKEEAQFYYIEE